MRKGYHKFKGTGVAIVTPFKPSDAIDFNAYETLVEHIIKGGADFLVVLGTTGESPTVSKPEKKALIEFTVKVVRKRIPIMVGIGGNSTSDVILAIHGTPLKGVDGILSVCPYYSKPQQEGIYQHFMRIAEASPVPVILYTVPGRTASNISAATTLRLARDSKNILGIKEASGNFDQICQVIKNKPKDFLVLSGDDSLTLPMIAAGADGVISVTANAFPGPFSSMVKSALEGDFISARRFHYDLFDFMGALFIEGSPAGIKSALHAKGLIGNHLRLPLVPVSPEAGNVIRKSMEQINV